MVRGGGHGPGARLPSSPGPPGSGRSAPGCFSPGGSVSRRPEEGGEGVVVGEARPEVVVVGRGVALGAFCF